MRGRGQSLQQSAYAITAAVAISLTVFTWDAEKSEKIIYNVNSAALQITAETARVATSKFAVPEPDSLTAPEWAGDWIKFIGLATEWEKHRASWRSFSGDLMRDPSFAKIVGMGPRAIPFILWQLEHELNSNASPVSDWFYALWAITDKNPIPLEAQGKPHEVAKSWIAWGIREGKIDADLGGALPTFG
jgi:hypothetical protein